MVENFHGLSSWQENVRLIDQNNDHQSYGSFGTYKNVITKWFSEFFAPYASQFDFDNLGQYWEYLDKNNSGYLEFLKSHPEFNVKIIDISDRDFVKNREDYLWVLDEICKV